jgi:hypothetical protein
MKSSDHQIINSWIFCILLVLFRSWFSWVLHEIVSSFHWQTRSALHRRHDGYGSDRQTTTNSSSDPLPVMSTYRAGLGAGKSSWQLVAAS